MKKRKLERSDDVAVWQTVKQEKKKKSTDDAEGKLDNSSVAVKKTQTYHVKRLVLSELALEQALPWHFEKGVSYHCLSWGNVDSLTYLRVILKQQRVEYAAISTWRMSMTDIREIARWLEQGILGRIDFYLGDLFLQAYEQEYAALKPLCKKFNCRLVIFRNHSKLTVVFGERFDAMIESSANVNTNPRMENSVITTDTELAQWYKEQLDGITPFNVDYQQPPIYERRLGNGQTAQGSRDESEALYDGGKGSAP